MKNSHVLVATAITATALGSAGSASASLTNATVTITGGSLAITAPTNTVSDQIGTAAPVRTSSSRYGWSLMTPFGVAVVLIASTMVIRRRRPRRSQHASASRQPWGPPAAAV